jgi:hypothetical protein
LIFDIKSKKSSAFRLKPNQVVKFLLLVAVLIFLFWQISDLKIEKALFAALLNTLASNLVYFSTAVALLFLNYFFEVYKWFLLANHLEAKNFRESTIDVLKGLRVGLLTPLMIGDFLGRSLSFKKENKTAAMCSNLFNSICQTYSTLFFGFLSILFWWLISDDKLKKLLFIPVLIFGISTVLGLFFVFKFRISWNFLWKWSFFKPYINSSKTTLGFDNKFRMTILLLSLARTMVFNIQFLLFYISFGIQLPFLIIFIGVNLTLLIKTIGGGLNVFGDLTIREFVSINFFGMYHVDVRIILVVTFVVWFINIFLPVLIGFFIKPKL